MAQESHQPKEEPVPDYQQALSNLSNPELLSTLDLALLDVDGVLRSSSHSLTALLSCVQTLRWEACRGREEKVCDE